MNIVRTRRLFALLAMMGMVVAAFAFLFGSGPTAPRGAEAAGALTKSVSCADIYQDLGNDTPIGNAPDGNDVIAAAAMTRTDVPSQTGGDADATTVSYLGPDLVVGDDHATGGTTVGNDTDNGAGIINGDLIPDTGPTTMTCAASSTAAAGAAEANTFNARTAFGNQYGIRPTATARYGTYDPTNSEDGAGAGTCGNGTDQGGEGGSAYGGGAISKDATDTDCYDYPGTGANTIVFSGCAYSESGAYWGRTDSFTVITSKAAGGTNNGRVLLWVATAVPTTTTDSDGDTVGDTATNPNQCTGGLGFPSVSVVRSRDVRTDQGTGGKNAGLTADADGAGARDSSDGVADDWDGDGCTDWDELDKNFGGTYPVTVAGPVNGTDPFNPNDCDTNLDSDLSIITTVIHDTSNAFLGTGNGQYFKCIADGSDPKGGATRTIAFRFGCYADSTVSVVNSSYTEAGGNTTCPPAPQAMCGDGKLGGLPPSAVCLNTAGNCSGAYLDIDIAQYPVTTSATCASTPPSNCYNPVTGQLSLGGCFAGLGGAAFGPNVYGAGSFDARVGAGSFTITIGITSTPDCQNGPPFSDGSSVTGTATFVELGSKKTPADVAIPIQNQKNSDRDGCSDAQELRAVANKGGFRDPYDDYDYLNPTGDKLNRVDDILAVVNQYFADDPVGDIDYASLTDRTVVPGANAWNLGPPNGQQRVDDILNAVKQYFHDCDD